MTLKGGTSQACAACKYQRRRCTPHCQLAPYFPADQPKMFQNAHRLFGVSNILKILKQLDPSLKTAAMRSIIYQANIRDKYPVYGCLGIVQHLFYQIQLAEEELKAVHAQLCLYKQHQHQHQPEISNNNNNNNTNDSTTLSDPMSQLQLGLISMSPSNSSNGGLPLFHHHQDDDNNKNNNNNNIIDPLQYNSTGTTVPELPIGSNLSYTTSSNGYMDSKETNSNKNNSVANALWIQQQQHQSFNDLMHPSSQFITTTNPLQPQQQQYEIEEAVAGVVQDYDDIHPFFDTIEDRQSYIDSKEAYDSSSESSLKDTTQSIEHVAENELKSAAACFTLTSVI